MSKRSDLADKLNMIMEAPLNSELSARLDAIIQKLQSLKDYDYGPSGNGYNSFGGNNLSELLRNIDSSASGFVRYGKSQQQLEKEAENERVLQTKKSARDKLSSKFVSIVRQFADQFPRYVTAQSKEIQFVQPNGQLVQIPYEQLDQYSFVDLIVAFRKLYNSGALNEADSRVQQIRDFGFNISSKIVSTEFSSFRTRYSILSDVILSYSGPMVVNEDGTPLPLSGTKYWEIGFAPDEAKVANVDVAGSCNIQISLSSSNSTKITIENNKLEHLGEIIDTIDIVAHTLQDGLGNINDIQCMGDDIVEYVIRINSFQQERIQTPIFIASSQVTNLSDFRKYLYSEIRKAKNANAEV